ncbi:MAG: phage holin family protein [Gemmatimonadales bacterium]|jgi:putative membrane protein
MLEFLIHLVVTALLLLVVAHVVPGVQVEGMKSALIAALILGVVNALVRPLVVFLTIPITILTLGLSLLAINALMFLLTSKLVPGFRVEGCLSAFIGSLVFSVLNLAVSAAFGV